MEAKIICARSKKGNLYYALVVNGVYCSFDVKTLARVAKLELRDIYLLDEGEYINLNERSY